MPAFAGGQEGGASSVPVVHCTTCGGAPLLYHYYNTIEVGLTYLPTYLPRAAAPPPAALSVHSKAGGGLGPSRPCKGERVERGREERIVCFVFCFRERKKRRREKERDI